MEDGIELWRKEGNATLSLDSDAKEGKASLLLQSEDAASKDNKAVLAFDVKNEKSFTHQSMAPAVYVWGYLAGRK